LLIANAQESRDGRYAVVDTLDTITEVLALVQRLPRRAAFARCQRGKPNPHLGDRREGRLAQRLAKARLDLDIPDKARDHRNDFRGFDPMAAVKQHGVTRMRCRRVDRPLASLHED